MRSKVSCTCSLLELERITELKNFLGAEIPLCDEYIFERNLYLSEKRLVVKGL